MARRRRRRWVALLLLLALIAFVLGRGLGLFPSPGATAGSSPPPPSAPDADARPAPDPAPSTTPGDAAGALQDRMHSLRSTLAAAGRSGRLGAGYAAVAALRTAALPAAELDAARAELDAALQYSLARLREELAQGRVLLAHKRLLALLQDGAVEVQSALDRFGSSQGWPPFTLQMPAAAVPAPEPLPRDLLLRADWHGTEVSGRVVDARSSEVTLRVASAAGVTFPTLAVTAIEPLQPNPVLAAELGFAALRAREGLLGRCWLVCGLICGSPPPIRLQELAALLQ